MKITTTIIENQSYSQIFVDEEELKNKEIKNEIEEQKKKANKVAIFVSGKKEMLQIIKKNIIYTFGNTENSLI